MTLLTALGMQHALADNVYLSLYLGNITFNNNNQLAKGAYKWNGTSFVATKDVEALSAANTYVIGMWNTSENPETTLFKPVTTTNGGSVVIVGDPDDPSAANARAEGVPALNDWDVAAPIAAAGYTTRRSTSNKITINISSSFALDLRLDNVWSTANGGSLLFEPKTGAANAAKIYVDLKGDNRLNAFRITNDDASNSEAHIGISKAGVRSTGTLTVGIYKAPSTDANQTNNHYAAVIGNAQGSTSNYPCYGIFIEGGTIYAGAVKDDHNTCIGGGGNNDGYVTITGGTVTAVNATTGTAIGGGRGWSSRGGNGFVTITGGTVYAYNYGDYAGDNGYGPNCAIGGGSSQDAHRGTATVVISEANASNPTNVYAEALGAPAIGGGCSYKSNKSNATVTYSSAGADASVTISGGTVRAISQSGQIKRYNGTTLSQAFFLGRVAIGGGIGSSGGALTFDMTGGSLTALAEGGIAIGGGYAGSTDNTAARPGGDATITISGENTIIDARSVETSDGSTTYPATISIGGGYAVRNNANSPGGNINFTMHGGTLKTGSIGGGINTTANASNGTGTFVIDGGTLHGQLLLWADAASSSLTMSGGSIQGKVSNGNTYTYIENYGGGVYMGNGTFDMSGGSITGCTAPSGGGVYLGNEATFNMSGGSITGCTADVGSGGGVYKIGTMYVSGSPIVRGNTISDGTPNNVYIPYGYTDPYILIRTDSGLSCGTSIGVTKSEANHTYTNSTYTVIAQDAGFTYTSNVAVPLYGQYMNRVRKGEIIIPASFLKDLEGQSLSSMTFHLSSQASSAWGGSVKVFLREVEDSSLTDHYLGYSASDVLFEGTLNGNAATMPVVFTRDYTYNGGNLLIGFWKEDKTGTNSNASFTGIDYPGASASASDQTSPYNNINNVTFEQRNFIPKITFTKTDNNTWVFPDDCNQLMFGNAITNHYFFDDKQICGVYNSPIAPYSDPGSTKLYFVKHSAINNWLAYSASTSSDYEESGSTVTVKTAAGLSHFAKQVLLGNDYAGKTVVLSADINLAGHNWEPIGYNTDCDENTMTFAGVFDGKGHSIYNMTCNSNNVTVGLFGHVTGTVKNVIVSGTVSGSATNLGGIAGEVGDGGEIYNSVSMVSPTDGTNFGSFVGKVGGGGSLKNSFANTTCTNGLVGDNEGTVENCYANGASCLAGSNTGSIDYCYYGPTSTADNNGTNGTFSAVVKPYEYGVIDNQVTANNTYVPTRSNKQLVEALNNWVGSSATYAHWGRATTATINGDYPILKMNDCEAVAANSSNPDVLHYGTANSRISDYTSATDAIYLYKSTTNVASNSGSSANLFIDEDAAITQAGSITANVGVSLKNTQAPNANSWDWHMFSPAISDAPLGVAYTNNDRVPFGTEPTNYSFNANGYFPTIAAGSYGEIDYYCYFEPQYHWINFKRNGNSHWHEDGEHEHIDYKATPSSAENVNEANLVAGKGYLLATKRETLLQAEGTLNNADVSVAVTTDAAYRKGYNLIGNPYQSYYDFNAFASDNSTLWEGGTSNASYILLSGDTYTAYAYNASNNAYTAPRWLHPHQGFMVIADNAGTATFYNNKRITEGESAFRDELPNYALVNLIVADEEGKRDLTTVELGRPDKGGAAKAHDLHLGKGCLYTHYEGSDYSIAFTQPGVEQVGIWFEADEEAPFTMTWDTENGEFSYLHLIDNITGADIDCLKATEYRFTATPDDYKSRFRLVFGYTGIDEPEAPEPVEGPTSFAFQMGNEIVVNGEGLLQLFDVTGRVMMQTTLNGTQSVVALPKTVTGVYVLRLTSNKETRTQKIMLE